MLDERAIRRGDGKSQKARGNSPKLSLKELTNISSRNGIVLSCRSTISHKARISPSLHKSQWACGWACGWALGIHSSFHRSKLVASCALVNESAMTLYAKGTTVPIGILQRCSVKRSAGFLSCKSFNGRKLAVRRLVLWWEKAYLTRCANPLNCGHDAYAAGTRHSTHKRLLRGWFTMFMSYSYVVCGSCLI